MQRSSAATIELGAQVLTLQTLASRMTVQHHVLVAQEQIAPEAELGIGCYDLEPLREGMLFTRFNVRFTEPRPIEVLYRPNLFLGLLRSGNWRSKTEDETCEFTVANIPRIVYTAGEGMAHSLQRPGEHCDIVGLNLEPEAFPALAERVMPLESRASPLAQVEFAQSTLLIALLRGLAEGPYRGRMAALYRESQSLAALVEAQRLLDLRAGRSPGMALAPRRDRVEYARQIIEAHLAEPLTMRELAHRLATNETTLRKEFRAVFGVTIFDYLRDRRLEVGRAMLLEGGLSIAEVAFRCGYVSPANFATAYRKRFGHPPSVACGPSLE